MGNFDEVMQGYSKIKCFLKGPPGDGKTVAAATISHLCPTLFIDVEGGILAARDVVNKQNITVRQVKNPDPKGFFEMLSVAVGEAMSGEYGAVVIDSISEVSGRMEDEYASASKEGRVDIKDWFVLTERVKRFSRLLRDLPCHTIVTAITKPTGKEGDDSKTIFEPVLPGQTAAIVPSFFDVVALMRKRPAKKGNDYYMVTDGPSLFQVRDRTRTLSGEELIDASKPGAVWKKAAEGLNKLVGKEA
jgi:hypothetical protein